MPVLLLLLLLPFQEQKMINRSERVIGFKDVDAVAAPPSSSFNSEVELCRSKIYVLGFMCNAIRVVVREMVHFR